MSAFDDRLDRALNVVMVTLYGCLAIAAFFGLIRLVFFLVTGR